MSHPTPTECQVWVLIRDHLGNQEIADRLGIAPSTVKSHIASLYKKTGARNRVELAQQCDRYLRNEIRRLQGLLHTDDAPED